MAKFTYLNEKFAIINIGDDSIMRGQSRTFDGEVPEGFRAFAEYFVVTEEEDAPKGPAPKPEPPKGDQKP